MAGMIPQPFIDDLLSRINIVDIVSSRVSLKRAGQSYKACCPFHKEKTPSFNVVPDKQFYHCFGCGVHGDAISFIREFDNLSFTEAVEELASQVGMEVPRSQQDRVAAQAQRTMLDALEAATHFYEEQLYSHHQCKLAQGYLQQRGLSSDIIKQYRLGFAPAHRNNLAAAVSPEDFDALIEARLISNKYEQPFDLFQNRVIFPIRNTRGKTVGFGGRTLGDDKAKYINSPESPAFHKSKEIYGLYEAYQSRRQLDQLLVVEGYMDVVSLAQFGITEAVATLGTATNTDNLTSLLHHCKNLIFCFDGDQAGFNAAKKAMLNSLPILEDGTQLSFLLLPQGEDPDTLVRKEGEKAFRKRMNEARPLSSFFFDVFSQGLNLEIPEHKGKLRNDAKEILNQVASRTLKSALWDQLNKLTSTFQKRDSKGYSKHSKKPNQFERNKPDPGYYQAPEQIRVQRKTGHILCLAIYYQPSLAPQIRALLESQHSPDLAATHTFARYAQEHKLQTQAELLYQLATDSTFGKSFYTLFDGIELLAEKEIAIQEAQDVIHHLKEKHRLIQLIDKQVQQQAVSDEERVELSRLSNRQSPSTH